MRDQKIWQRELLSEIRTIADKQELRRLWSGEDSGSVSSFSEEVAHVFDDYDINGFIAAGRERSDLDFRQFGALIEFRDRISTYVDRLGATPLVSVDYEAVLADPHWAEVVEAARDFTALVDGVV